MTFGKEGGTRRVHGAPVGALVTADIKGGVALLLSGIGALPSIAFAAISMAGMEQSMRIVRDPRWMVAYAGAGLTGLMAALAAWMVSPLAGTLIGFVALATAVRLVLAALATVR